MRASIATAQSCGCMDVALVVDDTGSMDDAIANVESELSNIIAAAQAVSNSDVRFGLITFKDEVQVDVGLTTDLMSVGTAVMGLSASGGGSEPEASDEALRYAVTGASSCGVSGGPFGDFRPNCLRIAVLITDAPPGGCDDAYVGGVDDVAAADVAAAALAAGVRVSAVYVPTFGVSPTTQAIMTQYASTTQGIYRQTATNGQGTGQVLQEIVRSCGGAGPQQVPAPVAGAPVLALLVAALGVGGGLRLRASAGTQPSTAAVARQGGDHAN